jgi:hypothetical protein
MQKGFDSSDPILPGFVDLGQRVATGPALAPEAKLHSPRHADARCRFARTDRVQLVRRSQLSALRSTSRLIGF